MAVKSTISQALLGQFSKTQVYRASYKSQSLVSKAEAASCWRTYSRQVVFDKSRCLLVVRARTL